MILKYTCNYRDGQVFFTTKIIHVVEYNAIKAMIKVTLCMWG